MDPSEIDALVQRLVANPHDEEALAYAHNAGAADPKSYALLLEKVGTETHDPAYAAHWLSEAANVWSTTLGDAHRAARVLMLAIDKDPTQQVAADRLAQLYRDKGDVKALVALLERRSQGARAARRVEPGATRRARRDARGARAPLERRPAHAAEEGARELPSRDRARPGAAPSRSFRCARCSSRKVSGTKRSRCTTPSSRSSRTRRARLALLRDEAATRKLAGDLQGATRALAAARQIDDNDPALQQEYAVSILDRIGAGENVPEQERAHGAELLVALAEVYDGEHGLAYAGGALDIEPGHDRALQLFAYYARALEREGEISPRYPAYVRTNPDGAMAVEARHAVATDYEAAGEYRAAVEMLEPLRTGGDNEAAEKLKELYPLAARQPGGPVEGVSFVAGPAWDHARGVRSGGDGRSGVAAEAAGRSPPGDPRRRADARGQGEEARGARQVQGGARDRSRAPRGALLGRGLPSHEARLRPAPRRSARERARTWGRSPTPR